MKADALAYEYPLGSAYMGTFALAGFWDCHDEFALEPWAGDALSESKVDDVERMATILRSFSVSAPWSI